jgi:hypothetical protein|tara:strand:- start:305 stop:523 length:219 start_codon:yes stop_codon:yes gene_type:complete
LLVGIALWLLRLHLHPHGLDLLRFNSQPLKELLARLLIAAESAKAGAVVELLAAVDAESHVAPSKVALRRLI